MNLVVLLGIVTIWLKEIYSVSKLQAKKCRPTFVKLLLQLRMLFFLNFSALLTYCNLLFGFLKNAW